MADAMTFLYKYRKPTITGGRRVMSFRAIASTWQCQPLYNTDNKSAKGAKIIREDGARTSPMFIKNSYWGAHHKPSTSRGAGQSLGYIDRKLTLFRLLIVGEKGLSNHKRIAAQKAAFLPTKNIQPESKIGKSKSHTDAKTTARYTW